MIAKPFTKTVGLQELFAIYIFVIAAAKPFFLQVTRCREVKTNEGLMCSNCGFGL